MFKPTYFSLNFLLILCLALGLLFSSASVWAHPPNEPSLQLDYRAEQGEAMAQWLLGSLYRRGDEKPQDDKQAVFWFRKAAEQGFALAQFSLGDMLEKGRGIDKDIEQALVWYRKAADQGDRTAQAALTRLEPVRAP